MDSFAYDAKLALRSLLKQPLFFAVVVLTFALGVGANTALFSVVYGVVHKPLGFRDEARLVAVAAVNPQEGLTLSGHFLPDFWFWREHVDVRTVDAMAFYGWRSVTLQEPDRVERLDAVAVSANVFEILGLEPALGRVFAPEDEVPGDGHVALISHGLWQRVWGRDPEIVGRVVRLNGELVTVIGVMPESTRVPSTEAELWRPVGYIENYETSAYGREERDFSVIGHLAPGASEAAASAEMARLAASLAETYPATNDGWTTELRPLRDQIVGGARTPLYIAFAAVGLVFLIACTNIANLLLVRATSREREMAVRAALGAGRGRLFQQQIVESLVLTCAGGAAGIVIAAWLTSLLLAFEPGILPRADSVSFGAPVLLFALGASLVTGVVFGAVATLQRASGSSSALGERGGELGASRRQNRTRMLLVGGELALALTLLVGSGMLLKALRDLSHVDPGFRPDDVYASHLILSEDPYRGDLEARRVFFKRLAEEVGNLPGVSGAALTTTPPVPGAGLQMEVPYRGADGPLASETGAPRAALRITGPGYFATIGTPMKRGRDFTARDGADAPGVVILNETLARRAFGNEDPLGRTLELVVFGETQRREVIGISGDTRFAGLDQPPKPALFVPHPQLPFLGMGLVARSTLGPAVYAETLRKTVGMLDPRLAVMWVDALDEALAETLSLERFYSVLLIVFASVALVLAATGIYGVFAFWVSRRRREMGLRIALGATPGDVLWSVLSRGMSVTLPGLAVGTLAALVLGRSLEATFRGVNGADPLVLGAAAVVLTAIAFAACWVPAREAARVEPSSALRAE